jgi:hypothetical protein
MMKADSGLSKLAGLTVNCIGAAKLISLLVNPLLPHRSFFPPSGILREAAPNTA